MKNAEKLKSYQRKLKTQKLTLIFNYQVFNSYQKCLEINPKYKMAEELQVRDFESIKNIIALCYINGGDLFIFQSH